MYTGIWTDWSKDSQVLGSTITVTSSASRLLTAFLALYISLSVSYLWLLVVYNIHRARYRITTGKCRAVVRQQQALLKASLSPTSTNICLIKLYWAYRSTPFAWRQSWLWILISAASAVSGIAVGLFSSQIMDSSLYIDVLVNSSNCGCPFENMCIGPAIRLDAGLLNSNSLLGINSPTADQIELRKVTTCTPILQEGYTELRPAPSPGDQVVAYLYGPILGANATWVVEMEAANITRSYTIV